MNGKLNAVIDELESLRSLWQDKRESENEKEEPDEDTLDRIESVLGDIELAIDAINELKENIDG